MKPRRRSHTWFSRLGAIVEPKTVGAVLLVIGGWVENRQHTDSADSASQDGRRVLWARTVQLERRVDSLFADNQELRREIRRRRARGQASEASVYGPAYAGPPVGTLTKSVGRILHGLFFWMRSES